MRSSIAVTLLLAAGLAAVSADEGADDDWVDTVYYHRPGFCAQDGTDVDVNEQDEGMISRGACGHRCDDRSGCTAFEWPPSHNCKTFVNPAINSGTGDDDADCFIKSTDISGAARFAPGVGVAMAIMFATIAASSRARG